MCAEKEFNVNGAVVVTVIVIVVIVVGNIFSCAKLVYTEMMGDDGRLVGLSRRLQAKEYAGVDGCVYTLNNKPVTWWQWYLFIRRDMETLAKKGYEFVPSFFAENHELCFGDEFEKQLTVYHVFMSSWRKERGGRPSLARRPKAPYHYCQYSYRAPQRQ